MDNNVLVDREATDLGAAGAAIAGLAAGDQPADERAVDVHPGGVHECADADESRAGGDTTALPVAVALPGPVGESIRRWVEGTLGWQPVEPAPDALVPPAVLLRGLAQPTVEPDVPTVLVVDDEVAAADAAARAVQIAPAAVTGWPSGRDGLEATVQQVLAQPTGPAQQVRTIRVGGAAGGVGTTTVTLALAGLCAWKGQQTLAVVHGPMISGRTVSTAALAAADVYAQADGVVGVPNCRALKRTDMAELPPVSDQSVDTLMVDVGVTTDADVLVCRPDAAGQQMVSQTSAAAVVVVGDGPVSRKTLESAAAGRPVIDVPWSARVARAAAIGRLPASLPGAWLRRLVPLTPREGAQ